MSRYPTHPLEAVVPEPEKYLIVQTAFLGDVILTLPLVQLLRKNRPDAVIDIVVAPRAAGVLEGHPALSRLIVFDKNGADRGITGLLRLSRKVRSAHYDRTFIPHRSLRSALLAFFGGIPSRIGFHNSAGKILLTSRVRYRPEIHEISRNIELLSAGGITGITGAIGRRGGKPVSIPPPRLSPSGKVREAVDRFLGSPGRTREGRGLVCLAPGTLWKTKRWMGDRFASLAGRIAGEGYTVVLVGGPEDTALCAGIGTANPGTGLIDASGRLSVLESAELIGRAKLLVSNDSAPLHLACAMNTPVVAIFGATVPGFGFGPIGPRDVVVEAGGLDCRPCSIHGGAKCPIRTFDCMERISVEQVHAVVMKVLSE
jgi:heptosyltransferase-2